MIFIDTNIVIEYLKGNTTILRKYNLSHNMKIMDALIASTVMTYDLELMTLNLKDFSYIKQIKLV